MRLLKLQLKDGTWSGKVCKMVMRSMSKTKKSGLEPNRKRDEKADIGRMYARESCVLADTTFASSEDAT